VIPSQIGDIEISLLTSQNSNDAFELVCEVFVKSSVLHQAVGVSLDEYREYLRGSYTAMWQQGLSLVAIDTASSEIVGCLVSRAQADCTWRVSACRYGGSQLQLQASWSLSQAS